MYLNCNIYINKISLQHNFPQNGPWPTGSRRVQPSAGTRKCPRRGLTFFSITIYISLSQPPVCLTTHVARNRTVWVPWLIFSALFRCQVWHGFLHNLQYLHFQVLHLYISDSLFLCLEPINLVSKVMFVFGDSGQVGPSPASNVIIRNTQES